MKKGIVEILRHFRGIKSAYETNESKIWETCYPKGEVVLDIGSNRDTPFWFLKHGAKKVIAIDRMRLWPFFIGNRRIKFIQAKIDSIKIDIEGSEKGIVIETHYPNPHLTLLHDFENGVKLWRLE